ncbi:hypothetical protein KKF34_19390 [Myxococcota bacterium]|nr:hypothetical protein [Myxococcota bacterium]MBU1383124.1 hypothetical protein [Myxococcota bacterium]MBU1499053.1 hypothetical protein [Myxococcota bacterium]
MNRKEELAHEFWGDLRIRNDRDLHTLVSELGRKDTTVKDRASELAGFFLVDGRPLIRHSALASIMELNRVDDHFEQIEQMLDDDYPMVREAATVAMGRTTRDTEQLLVKLLRSPHTEVRFQAPISLVEKNYSSSAHEILKRLDEEGDQEIKTNLMIALGDLSYTEAINKVLELHKSHPYEIIRFEAAFTATRLGDTSCSDFLLRYTTHDVYGENAVNALEAISNSIKDNKDVLRVLQKNFRKIFLSTERRISIASLMVRLGDNRTLKYLEQRTSSFIFQTRMQALDKLGHTSSYDAARFLVSYIGKLTEKKRPEKETSVRAVLNICHDLKNNGNDITTLAGDLTTLSKDKNLDSETIKEISDFVS